MTTIDIDYTNEVLECVRVPGATFEFNSSFLRPSVLDTMSQVEAARRSHPDALMFVVGHTDRVGDEITNKKLSDRRAFSVYCFMTNDTDGWEALYNEEQWGLKVVQTILKDLGHDPGVIDGLMGPNTRRAMCSFLGIPPTPAVHNDAAFRKELFLAYMTSKHDVQVTEDQFLSTRWAGCGEYNPVVPPNAAELANSAPGNEPNRRVVVYLLREDRPVPCELDDVRPCKLELAKGGSCFGCAFYDSIATLCGCETERGRGHQPPTGRAKLRVGVFKEGDPQRPFAGAQVALLALPERRPAGAWNTGGSGFVGGIELDAGTYSVQVKTPSDPDWGDGFTRVGLHDGDDETAVVPVYRQGHTVQQAFVTVTALRDGAPAPGVKVIATHTGGQGSQSQQTGPNGMTMFTVTPGEWLFLATSLMANQAVDVEHGRSYHVTLRRGSDTHTGLPPTPGVDWTAYFDRAFTTCHGSWMMQKTAWEMVKSNTTLPGGPANPLFAIATKLRDLLVANPRYELPPAKVAVAECMRAKVRDEVERDHGSGPATQTSARFELWKNSGAGADYRALPDD